MVKLRATVLEKAQRTANLLFFISLCKLFLQMLKELTAAEESLIRPGTTTKMGVESSLAMKLLTVFVFP